jgi:SIR2-like domain
MTQFLDERAWETLVKAIARDYCLPVLGPEVCQGTLALRARIARDLAKRQKQFPLFDQEDQLVQVAQYLAVTSDHAWIWREDIAERLRQGLPAAGDTRAEDPYAILASLPIKVYATTNFDTALADALRTNALGGIPRIVHEELCPWWREHHDPDAAGPLRDPSSNLSAATPVVFYLFGNVTQPESLVLSEDDHLDFLVRVAAPSASPDESDSTDRAVLPNKLVAKLKTNILLFLGYRLNDFDFRILLRALGSILKGYRQSKNHPLIAVQLEPGTSPDRVEYLRDYLQSSCQRFWIKVVWGTCADFVSELGRQYEAYRASQRAVPAGGRS